jgi:hypothetical protein
VLGVRVSSGSVAEGGGSVAGFSILGVYYGLGELNNTVIV